MKKLKLNLSNREGIQVLSREQLKKITGGDDGSGGSGGSGIDAGKACKTDSDCGYGEACGAMGCYSTAYSPCKTDANCGNGLKCRSLTPPMSGTYCG